MPKMEKESITQWIGLDRITDTGNIREQAKYSPDKDGNFPESVKELAESVKKNGLLEPVIVKAMDDGNFELIAGFRRRAALQYLCAQGLGFNQIEAKIVSGDKLIIQLIENIQRVDLSAIERERGVFQMYESGVKQNEIAAQLSKSKSFVSIHISAYKMRQIAKKNGIETEGIETSTLSELLSIPQADLPTVLKDLVNFGGTRSAARQLAAAYEKAKNPPLEMGSSDLNTDMGTNSSGEEESQGDLPGSQAWPEPEPAPETIEEDAPPDAPPQGAAAAEPETESPGNDGPELPPRRPSEPVYDPIEPEHAEIDVNIILTGIYDYIDGIKKKMPDKGIKLLTEAAKINAANDIIALIHERLKNA